MSIRRATYVAHRVRLVQFSNCALATSLASSAGDYFFSIGVKTRIAQEYLFMIGVKTRIVREYFFMIGVKTRIAQEYFFMIGVKTRIVREYVFMIWLLAGNTCDEKNSICCRVGF